MLWTMKPARAAMPAVWNIRFSRQVSFCTAVARVRTAENTMTTMSTSPQMPVSAMIWRNRLWAWDAEAAP